MKSEKKYSIFSKRFLSITRICSWIFVLAISVLCGFTTAFISDQKSLELWWKLIFWITIWIVTIGLCFLFMAALESFITIAKNIDEQNETSDLSFNRADKNENTSAKNIPTINDIVKYNSKLDEEINKLKKEIKELKNQNNKS